MKIVQGRGDFLFLRTYAANSISELRTTDLEKNKGLKLKSVTITIK